MPRVVPVLVVVLVVSVAAATAHAQGNPAAEKLFRDGRTLIKQGKILEACDAFRRSQELEASVGTLLNLGACWEKAGRTATAWAAYTDAENLAARLRDGRRADAKRRAATLKPKLAQLAIVVPAASRIDALVVERNGIAVASAEWDVVIPLDPGSYVIGAKAPGRVAWTTEIGLVPKDTKRVEIPVLAVDATAAPPPPPPTAVGPTVTTTTTTPTAPLTTTATSSPTTTATGVTATAPNGRGVPPLHKLAIGVITGPTFDPLFTVGARALAVVPAPSGAVRFVVTGLYATYESEFFGPSTRITGALGAEYLYPFGRFGVAGGATVGVDYAMGEWDPDQNYAKGWYGLRASPIIARLAGGKAELGIHVTVGPWTRIDEDDGDEETVIRGTALAGFDYFVW